MTNTPASFVELEEAFEFVSADAPFEHQAWLHRATGTVHWHSEDTAFDEPLPEDIDDNPDAYLAIPHKKDLGLGKPLPLEFTHEYLPDYFEQVQAIFSRPGAYARFKDLLLHQEQLDTWHAYEAEHCRQALREWCELNDIALSD